MKKVVLITGGTDGLGKALARKLAATHTVVILGKDAEKAAFVANSIGCSFVIADVTDDVSLRRALHEVEAKFHRVDRLVNNAGIWIQGQLVDNDVAEMKKVLDVNTLGVMLVTRTFLPLMTTGGLIVNVISQAGVTAKAERSVYNASKWAVAGFTKSLELELAPLHIRVSGFYPGAFRTDMFEKAGNPRDMSKALPVEEVAAALAHILESPEGTIISETVIRSANY